MSNARRGWLWLIPALLMMIWLGARRLNADIPFVDEYWSIYNAGAAPYGPASPAEIWRRASEVDPGGMGVLYYYLLAAWSAAVGSTPYALRAFSLLAGALAVAWTHRLGRDLFSPPVGLYAAATLASSAFFIDYLHEARAYTLFALLTAFTVWVYWRVLTARTEPGLRWYGLLVVSLAALAYTHYVAAPFLVVLGAFHGLFVPRTARWRRVIAAAGAAGVLYLPWLSVTLEVVQRGIEETSRQATTMNAGQVIETLLHTLSNGSAALLALAAVYALRERRREFWMVGFLSLSTVLVIVVVNAVVPFMVHLRYLIGLWPLLALLVGLGMRQLVRAGLKPALVLAVWMAFGVWQSLRPAFIDDLFGQVYRAPLAGVYQALAVLRQRAHPQDMALFHLSRPGYEPFNYFVLGYLMRDIPARYDQVERMNNSFARDDNHYLLDVNTALADAPFVWTLVVPEVPTTQRSVVVDYVLSTRYARCETILNRPDMRMTLYARIPGGAGGAAPYFFSTGTGGGDEIRLFPLQIEVRDRRLDAVLGWGLDASVPPDMYSAAVHLEDAQGQLAAQADHSLPAGWFGCSAAHIALDDLPPGEYTLLVGVYNWQSGERLTGTVHQTRWRADRLPVTTFTLR